MPPFELCYFPFLIYDLFLVTLIEIVERANLLTALVLIFVITGQRQM